MSERESIKRFEEELLAVACLPPGDPVRVAFEESSLHDAASRERWFKQLAEIERVRLTLRGAHIPPDLQESLMLVPRHAMRERRRNWFRPLISVGMIALLACTIVMVGMVKNVRARRQRAVVVATLAVNHLMARPLLTALDDSPTRLARRMRQQAPFEVSFPAVDEGARLRGGEVATLDGHPVVHSHWHGPASDFDLFEFKLSDFDVASSDRLNLQLQDVEPEVPPCHAELWSEGEVGFLLLKDVALPAATVRR